LLSKRTMDNCRVIKAAVARGIGKPLTEEVNGKKYCQGYQKSEHDDEPYIKCLSCRFNVFYES